VLTPANIGLVTSSVSVFAMIDIIPGIDADRYIAFQNDATAGNVFPTTSVWQLTITQVNSVVFNDDSSTIQLLEKECRELKISSEREKQDIADMRNEMKRQSDLINQLIGSMRSETNLGYVKVSQPQSEDDDEKSLQLSESFVNQFQSLVGSRLNKSKPSSVKSSS